MAEDTQVEEAEVEEAEVEDEHELQVMWLPNGLPLFLGDVDDVLDRVKDMGYSIFFVLGSYQYQITEELKNGATKMSWSDAEPRVYRVTSNFIGHSITLCQDDDLGLSSLETIAYFRLPRIPYERIQMLDNFFREVDKKFHSEAIVMLTYDPRIGGYEGWGILVPEQENNAGHCDYKPESVVDDKDDEVIIVGTAHSHPGMSAFASHTDHNDQKGNDGIHITFGWKGNSNITEHYIELQMGGGTFILEEEQAFIDGPEPPSFPVVEDWMKNVKKKSYLPSTVGTTHSWQSGGGSTSSDRLWQGGFIGTRDPNLYYDQSHRSYTLPDGCPDPRQNTVVIRLLGPDEKKCPMCANFFRKDSIDRRRCWDCLAFLLVPDESVDDITAIRDAGANMPIWEIVPTRARKSIKIWERWREDDKVESKVETFFESDEDDDEEAGKD